MSSCWAAAKQAKYIAWTLAKKGMRAVVIERKYVGGSSPKIACLPSKNIIHSAKVASYFWRSGEFGITKDNCQIHMSGRPCPLKHHSNSASYERAQRQ